MFLITEKTARKFAKIRKSLNYHSDSYNIWLVGIAGLVYLFRKYCRILSENYIYNAFNTLCMLANTIILTTDGSVSGETEEMMYLLNKIFILISAGDKVIRLTGIGFK